MRTTHTYMFLSRTRGLSPTSFGSSHRRRKFASEWASPVHFDLPHQISESIVGVLCPVASRRSCLCARATATRAGNFAYRFQPSKAVILHLSLLSVRILPGRGGQRAN